MTNETFQQAAETWADTIYRVALHALSNRADAEDVMQTVLLKLYEHKGAFESEAHLKHWLLRLTINESRSLLRSLRRRRWVSLDEAGEAAAPPEPEQSELFQEVMALEPKYRLTIYLYYYEQYSVKEVAQAMSAKPSTVQTWLQRARERLHAALSEEGNLCSIPTRTVNYAGR